MSAFAALTLLDGAATPVSHTFTPRIIDASGVALYEDQATGVAVGFPQVTLSTKRPSKTSNGSKNYRIMQKVVFPVLEVSSPNTGTGFQPAPTKAYELIANLEFVIPERASAVERAHLQAFAANLLASVQGKAMIKDLDTIW
jgi:hypothetical protein